MFQLSVQDIHPGQQAGNKEEAIRQVAAALVSAGNVADGYVNGMLAREQQTSTFRQRDRDPARHDGYA